MKKALFIISDDLKASVLGCCGNTVCTTPNIARFAPGNMAALDKDPKRIARIPQKTGADAWVEMSAPHGVLEWFS